MAEQSFKLSLVDAVSMLNKAKKARFFVTVTTMLPVADKPGQAFPGVATISINRKQAIDFVSDVLKNFVSRKATINIELHTGSGINFYWIG